MKNLRTKFVIVESPYAADTSDASAAYLAYARAAARSVFAAQCISLASHLLYTQCLDDNVAAEREMGIAAGLHTRDALAEIAGVRGAEQWFFGDFGQSTGMRYARAHVYAARGKIEDRVILGPVTADWRTRTFLPGVGLDGLVLGDFEAPVFKKPPTRA